MDEKHLFQDLDETRTKRFTPAFIGIILAAVGLVVVVTVTVIYIQRRGPEYTKGKTVYNGVVREGEPGFNQYLHYLKIIDAAGQVSENLLGGQQAVVVGEIANSGSRTVDVVEIQAVLFDPDHNVIKTFTKTPIQPDFPLRPMEIRKFSVWVEPFPREWLTGTVEVHIYGYRIKK